MTAAGAACAATVAGAATGHPHGTEARYQGGPDEDDVPGKRCRCADCQRAHDREWWNNRYRMLAYGRWQPFVDAGPARDHVKLLGRYGIGWKRVAALAGLSQTCVHSLIYGAWPRPPSRRIRPETEAAILAVQPVPDNLADAAPVDATGSRRRLQALVACGWPQRWLATRLGWDWHFFQNVLYRKDRVTTATARAVTALYDALWDEAPPQDTPTERKSVRRARQLAGTRRWPLPQGWDDQAIDDPAATAEDCRRRHERLRRTELAEDAAELIRSPLAADGGGHHGQGYKLEHAAARLGVTPAALDQALHRTAAAEAAVGREDAA